MDDGLRDLLELTDELVVAVAPDGRVRACSGALRRLMGWPEGHVQEDIPDAGLRGAVARARAGEPAPRATLQTADGRALACAVHLRRAASGALWLRLAPEPRDAAPGQVHAGAHLQALLAASASLAIIACDERGIITLFTRGAERLYGMAAEDAVGRGIAVLPIDRATAEARARALSEELGRPVEGLEVFVLRAHERGSDEQVWPLRRPDGSQRWTQVAIAPVVGLDGRVAGYVGVIHDITERYAAASAREQLTTRLRGALDASMDALYIYDAVRDASGALVDLEVVDANRRAGEQVGRAREALIGTRLSALGSPERVRGLLALCDRVIATGEPREDEFCAQLAGRSEPTWLRYQIVRVGDGVAVTSRDITARKLDETRLRDSEQRLKLALEAAGDDLWDWDLVTGRVEVSRAGAAPMVYAEGVGFRPNEDFADEIHPDDRPGFHAAAHEHMSGKTDAMRHEYRTRTLDGRWRWVLGRGRVVARDAEGRPLRALNLETDIGARKQQEEALRRAVLAAEAASRAKSEFLAHVSHEIRTPMNAILGMVELALADDPPPRQRERLKIVEDSGRSLLSILNDLLDVAKIEAGKLELSPVAFDVRAELRGAVEAQGPRAQQKRLRLGWAVDEDVPQQVVGDPDRLRQVLVNLIGNAIKFTERGEVDVRAALVRAGEAVRVRFSVRDTGIGIPPDRRAAIFAPFEQADASTTRRFGGTGLGLTIASRLVELMGGEISVDSAVGVGSTFSFEATFAPADGAVRPATSPLPAAPPADARPLRVLLVEDNAINQLVASEMLQRGGHTSVVAGDGFAALDVLARERFDLVLMDLQMPGMDGWEVTTAIRRHADPRVRALPVLAMTARATEADRVRCLAHGMDGFLTKPLQIAQLLSALAAIERDEPTEATPMIEDWDVVLERVGGSRPLLARLIDMYCEEQPALAQSLRASAPGDREALRRAAHRVAGTVAMFNARELSAQARALEAMAPTGPLAELTEAAERVSEGLARLAAELTRRATALRDPSP